MSKPLDSAMKVGAEVAKKAMAAAKTMQMAVRPDSSVTSDSIANAIQCERAKAAKLQSNYSSCCYQIHSSSSHQSHSSCWQGHRHFGCKQPVWLRSTVLTREIVARRGAEHSASPVRAHLAHRHVRAVCCEDKFVCLGLHYATLLGLPCLLLRFCKHKCMSGKSKKLKLYKFACLYLFLLAHERGRKV